MQGTRREQQIKGDVAHHKAIQKLQLRSMHGIDGGTENSRQGQSYSKLGMGWMYYDYK